MGSKARRARIDAELSASAASAGLLARRRDQLRARVLAVRQLPIGPRRRFGDELKREIITYGFERLADHHSVREIAGELGMSAGVLFQWLRLARRSLPATDEHPLDRALMLTVRSLRKLSPHLGPEGLQIIREVIMTLVKLAKEAHGASER